MHFPGPYCRKDTLEVFFVEQEKPQLEVFLKAKKTTRDVLQKERPPRETLLELFCKEKTLPSTSLRRRLSRCVLYGEDPLGNFHLEKTFSRSFQGLLHKVLCSEKTIKRSSIRRRSAVQKGRMVFCMAKTFTRLSILRRRPFQGLIYYGEDLYWVVYAGKIFSKSYLQRVAFI